MKSSSSRIYEEDSRQTRDGADQYTKVMERISQLQNDALKNLDKYTKKYLLERFNDDVKTLKEQHQNELKAVEDELKESKTKFQREHSELLKLKKQQNEIRNLEKIKQLTEAIQKMNDQARQAEGRMKNLKDQTISAVTTLELENRFNDEKDSLIKEKKELSDKFTAVSKLLSEQQKKFAEKKRAEAKLGEEKRELTLKINKMELQAQAQKQSRIIWETGLRKEYNSYKEELKDTYDHFKDQEYKRRIREKDDELSKMKAELDKTKLSLTKEKTKVQDLENKITQLNKDVKKEQDRIEKLKGQIQDNAYIIAQFQRTSQELAQQNKLRQSHFQKIDHLQKKYSSSVEGVESTLKKNYQDLFKKLKEDYESTKNKLVNDLKAQLKQQKDKYSALQKKATQTEERQRQTILLFEEANALLQSSVEERGDVIKAIAKTVVGVWPKENDITKIKESIETNYNQLVVKLDLLKSNEESFKGKEQSWQKQLQELNRWLRNISNLLKSQQVQDIFSKAKKYNTNDKELRDILNKFSENLYGRLRKDKDELSSKVREINESKQQHQGDTQNLQKQFKNLQERFKANESQLIRLRFAKRQLERQRKEEEEKYSNTVGQLKMKIENSERQVKDYTERLAKLSEQKKSLEESIENYQIITIPALEKRITEQNIKSSKSDERSANFLKDIQTLQKEKTMIISEKEKLAQQNASCLSEIRRIREESQLKEVQHKEQLKRLMQAIRQSYDVEFSSSTFESILGAIKNNKSSKPLATSVILQRFSQERNTINTHISKFFNNPNFKAKFLYRYDDFHKKFQPYLPINESFDFIVICRIKEVIFGVISKGLGANSQALLFNANNGKTFTGDIKTASSTYDGGNLLFGNGEIRFKNNTSMQFVVNVRIFGAKYFNFRKEEIVGNEEATTLDELEIYRIDH